MTVKPMVPFLLIVTLSACNSSEPPGHAAPHAFDLPGLDELTADPVRLKELRRQCRTERPTMGDMLCDRVAEATRQRFYGDGDTPYTPPEDAPAF